MKTTWIIQNEQNQHSAYIKLVEKIDKQQNISVYYKGTIESMLLEFFSKTSKYKYTWKRATFKALLIHLYNQKCYALLRDYKSVEVLHKMSAFGDRMLRNVEDWENEYITKEGQLSALLKHSFTRYETPVFLENSFYGFEKKYMLWYIQLGKGKSIKELSQMPVQLTSKMAHEFRNAPAFLSANEALRFAQAIGYGASDKIAKVIALSELSVIKEGEEIFWAIVIMFLAKETSLKTQDINKVVDYLAFKYRENKLFSMKNRSFKALVKQAEDWYKRDFVNKTGELLEWKEVGVKPLYVEEFVDNKKVVYKTVELVNSIELFEEGNAMEHCVADYDHDCVDKKCAIFSLQKEVEGKTIERLATLEVELPSYELGEMQAKYNEFPEDKTIDLINKWIDTSEVKRKADEFYERPNVNQAEARAIGREIVNRERDSDSVMMTIKIILWLTYFILKFLLRD